MSRILLMFVVSTLVAMAAPSSVAKPDKVDGLNVPFGRIPQEIKDNRYPRTIRS